MGSKSLKHLRQWVKSSKGQVSNIRSELENLDSTLHSLFFAFLLKITLCWVKCDATSKIFLIYTPSSWKQLNIQTWYFVQPNGAYGRSLHCECISRKIYSIYTIKHFEYTHWTFYFLTEICFIRLHPLPLSHWACAFIILCESMLDQHCTMRKLKNGVKSGQLWQIISPPI